ncbi:uncharacterized protein LOC115746887 [Rhodamnia argentea]|uniref:Uncharacterized protein LOC115746887 n=1 Tax=Rhodamnia argentea TaxID=178133 RepID=A0A8B8PWQ5_9MYRT|nr:uncharacterized protein LOC115746887 [Rhodamnia argentea]
MAEIGNPTKRYRSAAPPLPSPIPTATGSRSAADEIFLRYLEASLLVPELDQLGPQHPRRVPDVIDLESLVLRDGASVHRLLRSAREFGAFWIRGHGVSDEASRSLAREAERVLEVQKKKEEGVELHEEGDSAGEGRGGDKEEVMRICFRGGMRWGQDSVEAETYRNLRQAIGEVTSKLDAVAQEVSQVLSENLRAKKPRDLTEMAEPTLCVHRHVRDRRIVCSPNHQADEPFDYALSIHLPVGKHGGLYLRTSSSPPYAFPTSPGTVLVALGKPVEEWSDGELKSASWEPIFGHDDQDPDPTQNDAAETLFSLDYKCSPPWLSRSRDATLMVVSIHDQILIALFLACLMYSLSFLFSY